MGLYTCLDDPYNSAFAAWSYPQDFIKDALREDYENHLTRRALLFTNTFWSLYV
jgi:hypothetical protein